MEMKMMIGLAFVMMVQFLFVPAFTHNVSIVCPSAIFGFADSLSDTGNLNLETPNVAGSLPYGISYGKPTGRFSDGLLVIDYLVQYMQLGSLEDPSLLYNGTDLKGLDFAYAGATVTPMSGPGAALASPHIFKNQIEDFLQYQNRTMEAAPESQQPLHTRFYSDALYYLQIGGDDLNFQYTELGSEGFIHVIPNVTAGLREGIMTLANAGARHILLLNIPAPGCSTFYLKYWENLPNVTYDEHGCLAEVNQLTDYFNAQIKVMIDNLRIERPELNLMLFDWNSAYLDVLQNGETLGITNLFQACCGVGGGKYNCIGGTTTICGCDSTVVACSDPHYYISFDGIHFTQKFNEIIAKYIFDGWYLEPRVKFLPGCGIRTP